MFKNNCNNNNNTKKKKQNKNIGNLMLIPSITLFIQYKEAIRMYYN